MTPVQRNAATLNSWLGILRDEPCYILGNGPSLDLEALEHIDAVTIGINRFYEPYSSYSPTCLIYQDERIRDELRAAERDVANRLDFIEIGCSALSRPRFDERRTILQVKAMSNRDTPDPTQRHKMPSNLAALCRNHSHAMAYQVAYLLGANPIVFAGVDCSYDYERDITNHYGGRPAGAEHNATTLPNCKRASQWIASKAGGRTIINCGLDCSLGPRRDLKEIATEYRGKGNYRARLLGLDDAA